MFTLIVTSLKPETVRYLATFIEGDWCTVKMFVGPQLRATSYRVKRSEIYKVLYRVSSLVSSNTTPTNSEDDEPVPMEESYLPQPVIEPTIQDTCTYYMYATGYTIHARSTSDRTT